MDVLTLCWVFDSRWFFGINFKLHMMWVPILIDLLTMIAYNFEDDVPGCCSSASSEIMLGLIGLGHVSLLAIAYLKTLKQKPHRYQNQ